MTMDCNETGAEASAAATRPAPDARPAESGNGTSAVGTHTQGPWTTDRRGTHGGANYTVIGTAENWHTEIARVYHGDRFANGEANARLIVAAPDLLWALRDLLELAEILMRGADITPAPDGAINQARAAIAKATGEQS